MKTRKPHSIMSVTREAMKYKTRNEFNKKSGSAYQFAWRNNILDDVCSHMSMSPLYSIIKWNKETATIEAKKYKTRSEFKRKCSGAYCYLNRCNSLDDLFGYVHKSWDKESVSEEAKKHLTRTRFMRDNNPAYKAAMYGCYLDSVCSHMESTSKKFDYDEVKTEALKYKTRCDFQVNSRCAYKKAYRHNVLDDICSHMVDGNYGFSKIKPAILYYIKFVIDGCVSLYKIGITNRSAKERLKGMTLNNGVSAIIIKEFKFENGINARKKEKELHNKFSMFKYNGSPIMKNGNTELFTRDVLCLNI